jgi:hypothetical protein
MESANLNITLRWSDKYTYPEDFQTDLISLEQALVPGHTYVQATWTFDRGLIVNPESVGQFHDDDSREAYAVVEEDVTHGRNTPCLVASIGGPTGHS